VSRASFSFVTEPRSNAAIADSGHHWRTRVVYTAEAFPMMCTYIPLPVRYVTHIYTPCIVYTVHCTKRRVCTAAWWETTLTHPPWPSPHPQRLRHQAEGRACQSRSSVECLPVCIDTPPCKIHTAYTIYLTYLAGRAVCVYTLPSHPAMLPSLHTLPTLPSAKVNDQPSPVFLLRRVRRTHTPLPVSHVIYYIYTVCVLQEHAYITCSQKRLTHGEPWMSVPVRPWQQPAHSGAST
jgi:hypothetical protein